MNLIKKQSQIIRNDTQDSTLEKSGCCSTTEDGNPICVLPQNVELGNEASVSCTCDADLASSTDLIQIHNLTPNQPKFVSGDHLDKHNTIWQKTRSGLMFFVAILTSPCCTPLIVPLALALFAGTPLAVWAGQHLGWVYGGLTLLSAVSLMMAFRWMFKNNRHKDSTKTPSTLTSTHQIMR